MSIKSIQVFLVSIMVCGLSTCLGGQAIAPAAISATTSSVNYQLEPGYSCDGSGLAGDLHTNQISTGAEPPNPGEGTMWLSNGVSGVWVLYEFDKAYVLQTMWVWNYNQVVSDGSSRTERGIRDCTIEYSTDGGNWQQLGTTHTFAIANASNSYAHNTEIDFGGINARFVKITVINNHGGSSSGLSEVRFYGGATLGFQTEESSGPEASSPAVIPVVLSDPSSQTVTVDYAATGGTAEGGGVDYTLAPGTLTFDPGSTVEYIEIQVNNDGLNEEDETIELTLSGLSGGTDVDLQLDRTAHLYTIADPRPSVGFAAETSSASEADGIITIPVVLSAACGVPVTVDYYAAGGTAEGGGVDYTLAPGTLTFDPGSTVQTIDLELVDDGEGEFYDETILVRLENPSAGAKSGLFEHLLVISDNEYGSVFLNSMGMEFVRIEPGRFVMGQGTGPDLRDSGSRDYDEQPEHPVMLTRPFYMLRNKVSQTQLNQAGTGGDASNITWEQANAFAEYLSGLEGRNYRMPTEAEWEYVYENPQGAANMSGREWTNDWHGTFHDTPGQVDPLGPATGLCKVVRSNGEEREAFPPNAKSGPWPLPSMSFRVVLQVDPPETPYIEAAPFTQSAIRQGTTAAQLGPDPGVPYFTLRFALPAPPDDDYDGDLALMGGCPATMYHQHSPGFEIMPNGDCLAVYFSSIGPTDEFEDDVRFVQARLRYGSDVWEMPELFYDFKHMNEQSGLLWTEDNGTVWFFGGGRIDNAKDLPFKVAISTDNGATWNLYLPQINGGIGGFTPQPCQNVFRDPSGNIYFCMDGSGNNSFLWRSTDGGVSWNDQGGRTNGRHSAVVPISGGRVLSLGGKNTDINGWMPKTVSTDWGQSWSSGSATPFPALGTNQRPCVTRMRNGHLAFCGDSQLSRDRDQPSGWQYGKGAFVAISQDEGNSWHIKALPVTLPNARFDYDGTLGYSTIREAPNGVLHVLATMTYPCLHYEMNEAWVFSDLGDITPETTGGAVQQFSEEYPGGATRATWSARLTTHGRYVLEGTETFYYENGQKQYECSYTGGKKTGTETFWTPYGLKLWSWEHHAAMSKWIHYWENGMKRVESSWDTAPEREGRTYSGRMGHGPTYRWNRCGTATNAWNFSNGRRTGSTALAADQARPAASLADISANWLWRGLAGDCGYNIADRNADGTVNFVDLALVAAE